MPSQITWTLVLLTMMFYGKMELQSLISLAMGVSHMTGVIIGIVVCAFVYVIRETLMNTADEDYENY